MGFYGVLLCGSRQYDNHLITALVERWRRETHTFHFRCGEATITLQDISIIWGLPIDGEPVIGIDVSRKVEEWQHICLDLLGFTPLTSHFKGGHLSMTALYEHCMAAHIDDNSPEIDVVKYTRCVALMIIGGIMVPDYQGGSVKLIFLQLLRDIERIRSYSWGSAVLAFLYRELCNATRIRKAIISGPLFILQVWAWSRITFVNPDINGLSLTVPQNEFEEDIPYAPYGARWSNVFSYTHSPTHAVRIIRDCFDRMTNAEFNWIVYNKKDVDVKAIISTYDNRIWRCVCPLICFDIVEMHRPDRVLRQFKMRQSIPRPALDNDNLHNVNRTGHRNTDWREYHKDAIILWNGKLSNVARGERYRRSSEVDDDYFPWYDRITVRFISPAVTGLGFRPYQPNLDIGRHSNIPQNFSVSSSDSQQSSSGFVPPRPSGEFYNAGPSGGFYNAGPSGGFDNAGPSSGLYNTGPFGGFYGAGPSGSYVDAGYHTPFCENIQSFTDLLNTGQRNILAPERNVPSPVIFPSYSDEQQERSEEIVDAPVVRRGQRRRRPPACGTGGHLYNCNCHEQ
ncbi:serine/threonine-protein phosphatase 7 long form homolog [Henckelia pumila]|uniref:serine/threonine-protein phosphatase 7 long form homolog n=1 Tax=Henckelia pumila TaxID=405737 RepID=UPI003C6DDA29